MQLLEIINQRTAGKSELDAAFSVLISRVDTDRKIEFSLDTVKHIRLDFS